MVSMRLLVLVLLLLPVLAGAQSSPPSPQAATTAKGQPPSPQGASASQGSSSGPQTPPLPAGASAGQAPAIALEPQGFDYDPDGRRDPFVSLLRRGSEAQRSAPGVRPPGLAGLETAEVTLKGTLQSRDGYVAMLQGADGKTYIVRPGDRLLDGTIRSITQNVVVIVQQVNDPLSLEKQREVRKTIRQTDEAK